MQAKLGMTRPVRQVPVCGERFSVTRCCPRCPDPEPRPGRGAGRALLPAGDVLETLSVLLRSPVFVVSWLVFAE